MPQLKVKTTAANQTWVSPDGKIKLYELTLDYDGQPVTAKTYSEAIATVGWSGDVETYEKADNRGNTQTFVKQPQKEGFSGGGGYRGGGSKPQSDPFTMYLSYAKDIMVALIATGKPVKADDFQNFLEIVLGGGHQLHDGRPGADGDKPDTVHAVKDEPVDLGALDSLVAGGAPVEEKPWPPTS